ncbi:MAG: hypothetical protein JWL90_2351 [Chthoniobacteraceae bacterium]|nr:hypothetical protein [Chthoniobacteraceae bacterium]
MFPRLFTLLCAVAFSCSAFAEALDPILAVDKLWSLKQDEFQAATKGLPFRWTSSAQDSARAASTGMTLFELPVYEVIARFDAGQLKLITATFYARGDAGGIPKEKFDALVVSASEAITKFTGTKFTPRGKDATNAVRADGVTWQNIIAHYLLEYSFTREVKTRGIPFRAEFVRLEIGPPEAKLNLLASVAAKPKFTGPTHLKRDTATGDVWLFDVPMVDQGQKGYCVVASTERVMRYFGNPVDANELAQIANSDAAAGTSLDSMNSALKKISSRFKVRVRTLEQQDTKGVLGMIKDYNRAAKRLHETEIPDLGMRMDLGSIFHSMNYDVLKEARTKNPGDLTRFQRSVQTHIDLGIPLLWSVQLGMAPEAGIPQSAGGHMRLIIGYNTTKKEILYSDSWGAGHELKRMPAADAWTITTGLTSVEPT